MDLGLAGRTVLVTGGTKGIGLACARAFVGEGARVAITSRDPENVARAVAGIGGDLVGLAADLTDADAAGRMVDDVTARLGPIDVLVTCAGAARRRPPDELSPAAWRAGMDAKFFPGINVIDPVVKAMGARGRGVIVNVIGDGGKVASPIHLAGGAANAALMLATVGLANAYAPRQVRVVGVNPGLTATERVADGLRADARIGGIDEAEALRRTIARFPIGRMATPEEIADVVVYLASERASYVTGVIVTMDGARTPVVV
jgi:NAD(P)-dependent dehydrogenase (short-subunit alcohol dehydrogenase family)